MEPNKNQQPSSFSAKVRLPYKGGAHIVKAEQIIRLEAVSNYTRIFFADRKPILMAKVLREYQNLLAPFGFIRVNRSHLVNPLYVMEINDGVHITMQNDAQVEISRRRRNEVTRTFTLSFSAA